MRVFIDENGKVMGKIADDSMLRDAPAPRGCVRELQFRDAVNKRVVALLTTEGDLREFHVNAAGELLWHGSVLPLQAFADEAPTVEDPSSVALAPPDVDTTELAEALAALAKAPSGGKVKGTQMLTVVYELARRAGLITV